MKDSATICEMTDGSRIEQVQDFAIIKEMTSHAKIDLLKDQAQIEHMKGHSSISKMEDQARVKTMEEHSEIIHMDCDAKIDWMKGDSRVDYAEDCCQISFLAERATIEELLGYAKVKALCDMAHIHLMQAYSSVQTMKGTSWIEEMQDFSNVEMGTEQAKIKCMDGYAQVGTLTDSAKADLLKDHAIIGQMFKNTSVLELCQNAKVLQLSGCAHIGRINDCTYVEKTGAEAEIWEIKGQAIVCDRTDPDHARILVSNVARIDYEQIKKGTSIKVSPSTNVISQNDKFKFRWMLMTAHMKNDKKEEIRHLKTSVTTDVIIQKIQENKMGVLLLAEDSIPNPINDLTHDFPYGKVCRFHIAETRETIEVIIYPVHHNIQEDEDKYMKTSIMAIKELFYRWKHTTRIRERYIKSPFASQEFLEYLDQIDYYTADYVIMTARK